MNILIVLVLLPCHMASLVRSAPVPPGGARPGPKGPAGELDSSLEDTLSVLRKVLHGVAEAHTACITAKTLVLNSDKGQYSVMADNIGVPKFPVLHVASEKRPAPLQESTLVQMLQGVVLHQTLLGLVAPRLGPPDALTELLADTTDLQRHLRKLLRLTQAEGAATQVEGATATQAEGAAPVLNLRLTLDFDVQVATHVTLQEVRHFGQDMERVLRPLVEANDDNEANEDAGPM